MVVGADFLYHPLFLFFATACPPPGPTEKVDFDDSQSVDEPQDSRPALRDRTTVSSSAMCCLQLLYLRLSRSNCCYSCWFSQGFREELARLMCVAIQPPVPRLCCSLVSPAAQDGRAVSTCSQGTRQEKVEVSQSLDRGGGETPQSGSNGIGEGELGACSGPVQIQPLPDLRGPERQMA